MLPLDAEAEPRVTCAQVGTSHSCRPPSHSWGSRSSRSSIVSERLKVAQAATQELQFLLRLQPNKVSRPFAENIIRAKAGTFAILTPLP